MIAQFRPAKRSEAKPLIGLYSESGCGKTLSALMLARGFVGPSGTIGMIESEAGRGEAYQGDSRVGDYLVCPIRETFSPKSYGEAITAAEKASLDALIIDSASHEWESAGGVLDMAATNQAQGKKGVLVWQQPKMEHARHFMLRLLATPIPLVIVCMRAKYPMQETKNAKGEKEWHRATDLEPKQADDILFEMFLHGWIDKAHKFHGTKYTLDSLRAVIVDGEPISVATGERLATWAKGESVGRVTPNAHAPSEVPSGSGVGAASGSEPTAPPTEDAPMLLSRIKAGFAKLGFSEAKQRERWDEICHGWTFLDERTYLNTLQALLDNLRAQARRTA